MKKQATISLRCIHNLLTDELTPSMKKAVSPVNKYVTRTHTCGELTLKNVEEVTKLCGWMEFQRMGKFITLRDSYGSIQLLVPEDVCE